MDLFWPLLMLRWLHLWSLLVLFGSALFQSMACRARSGTRPATRHWAAATGG